MRVLTEQLQLLSTALCSVPSKQCSAQQPHRKKINKVQASRLRRCMYRVSWDPPGMRLAVHVRLRSRSMSAIACFRQTASLGAVLARASNNRPAGQYQLEEE